jgi:plasmid maintenance system antidote protein VapI
MVDLTHPNYKPGNLLDVLADKLDLKNDAALARALGVAHPQISRIRTRHRPIGPTLLLVMSDAADLTIGQLRVLAGLPSRMYITR